MSREAGTYTLPADAEKMLDLYQDLYQRTGGALTPLIGQVLVDAGYDPAYSLTVGTPTRPPAWDDVLVYDFPTLTLKRPALLDFGAAGKGYLIDIVGGILAARGLTRFCIDAGGDLLYRRDDATTLRVGLEHPSRIDHVIGVATIGSGSICGSAGNRRTWGPYHHIINPHTLASPRHLLGTWVVAETALLADAIAGCLFFAPASALKPRYTFEYLILLADGTTQRSAGFPAEVFTG